MSFLWPHVLWLALLAPLMVLGTRWRATRRACDLSQAPPHIRRGVTSGGRVRFNGQGKAATFPWRFLLAFLLVVVALARPQWGAPQGGGGDARPPGDVLIALDLSRSMLARDVAPSRLERARGIADQLVGELPDRRIGLIGFAGAAHLLAPPSEDRAILKAFLPGVRPEHMVEPGTDFAALLDLAAATFGTNGRGGALVILTDGEAEPGVWRDRLETLRARHIQVIAVGVGTPGGAAVTGPDGKPLRKSDGAPVISRLDRTRLADLARATGGRDLDAARSRDLAALVRSASADTGPAVGAGAGATGGGAERFAEFLAAAALLLAWSAMREVPARPQLRRARLRGAGQALAGLAALGLIGVLPPRVSLAAAPLLTETDLQGEEDPLKVMTALVGRLVRKDRLSAADYLAVTEAATRYGEIHRGHGHPLQEGVMRDGLAAIDEGRRLNADLADWDAAEAKLNRLLVPPPPVPLEDPGAADPANEPMDARGLAPKPGEPGHEPGEKPRSKDPQATAGEQGLQNVGGSEKDVYDASEWRDAALVQPLDQLERLRRADSPAELFARMQRAAPAPARRTEQTW